MDGWVRGWKMLSNFWNSDASSYTIQKLIMMLDKWVSKFIPEGQKQVHRLLLYLILKNKSDSFSVPIMILTSK